MVWHARLQLDYRLEAQRCVARYEHSGPLRILQSLYPEGDGICHNVLVHPPGGLVGGDTLSLDISVGTGAHGLITTPGATRFYRSDGRWRPRKPVSSWKKARALSGCHWRPFATTDAMR